MVYILGCIWSYITINDTPTMRVSITVPVIVIHVHVARQLSIQNLSHHNSSCTSLQENNILKLSPPSPSLSIKFCVLFS